jgi:RNA polymerase sigma factor (sigma-70 family)
MRDHCRVDELAAIGDAFALSGENPLRQPVPEFKRLVTSLRCLLRGLGRGLAALTVARGSLRRRQLSAGPFSRGAAASMTDTGRDDEGEGGEDGSILSDAALARGMRSDADDAPYRVAWREFDRRHLPHVKRFIEARAHDSGADVCDDLLSVALERIQRGIDEYADQGPGKLRSWCIKIADRVVKDLWRGRLYHAQDGSPEATELVSFDEIEERYGVGLVVRDEADYAAVVVPAGEGDRRVVSERAQVLWEAFELLSDIDQAVIWCKMVQGDSDAYVAEITGKPVDHVRKIREKAVKKLRKRFDRLLRERRLAS